MKQETYFSQLDGVRFLAVGLVLIDHWMAERLIIPLGPLGVTMFFVLSGFLITRILIQSKITDDLQGRSHWFSVKQFIIRRSIRIFPIYFLAIFLLYFFDVSPVRDTIWWCVTYSTNLYIAINSHWMGTIDHLWSLAVEEQYYLFFPYLILFFAKSNYQKILFLMIFFSVLLRLYFYFNGNEWMVQYVLMPTCLDSFGLGGLLAYYYTFQRDSLFKELTTSKYLVTSSILLILSIFFIYQYQQSSKQVHHFGNVVVSRFVDSVFCFFLIAKAVDGYKGIMKWILENKFVSYLGRISYGLYLYHNFVFNVYHTPDSSYVVKGLHKIQRLISFAPTNYIFDFFYYFLVTVLIASISWYCIEKPLNNLKKYFTY